MSHDPFHQYLLERSDSIAAQAREAGLFQHGLTRGEAREDLLVKPLGDILPERFRLVHGEVRAADGQVSGKWDVLVIDGLETPRLYQSPRAAVVPIEGVLAAISVKSRIESADVREAAVAATLLRRMPRQTVAPQGQESSPPGTPWPPVFLYGFSGVAIQTIGKTVIAEAQKEPDLAAALTGVCIHGAGMIVPDDLWPVGFTKYSMFATRAGKAAFAAFVASLWTALMIAPNAAPNLLGHLDVDRLVQELAGSD